MGNFLAKQIKDQTDSILRRRQVSPGSSMTVRGGTTTPGTGPGTTPEVVEPNRDLDRHKSSGDHDGRYYTEGEIDGMLNFTALSDTPAAYTGQGSKIVAVKADVSGLEFVAAPPATNGIPTGGTNNQLLAKDGATDYVVKWMDAPAAANGLPQGGTAGQIPAKIDETDYNVEWIDPPTGGGGGMELIDEIVLANDGDAIEFTAIPQTYGSLYMEVLGRLSKAGTAIDMITLQVGNGSFDTGSNYAYRVQDSYSSSASYSATSMMASRTAFPQNGAAAGAVGMQKIVFPDYTNTDFWKLCKGESVGVHEEKSEIRHGHGGGVWKSTSAIERIKIVTGMATNTVVRLWGIPA